MTNLYRSTLLLIILLFYSNIVVSETNKKCSPLLNFTVKTLSKNKPVNLCSEYQGKVLLIVNTASKCAYTPQYKGLEALYEKYKANGLVVLGFPSNDFGKQEPGTEAQIKDFCELTYNVKFPMYSKTKVTSKNADPLYKKLGETAGEYPRWNFHKYLIDRKGNLVGSFKSQVTPDDEVLLKKIKSALTR
ncbi:MAG: glutathione peroxidase [Thiohalomonadales bacterium]